MRRVLLGLAGLTLVGACSGTQTSATGSATGSTASTATTRATATSAGATTMVPRDASSLVFGWGDKRSAGNPLRAWISGPTDAVTILPIEEKPADPPVVTLLVQHGKPVTPGGALNTDTMVEQKVTVTRDAPAHVAGLTISLAAVEPDASGTGGSVVLTIDPPKGAAWH